MRIEPKFEKSVFINCPFDDTYAPLLEAALFCIVRFELSPRLASEALDAGQNRLDKIVSLIKSCKYSIHDLSRCRSQEPQEYFRMNMPFEYGIDVGLRLFGQDPFRGKKFLILEGKPYELKRALSDIAGQDVFSHHNDFEKIIRHVRDFFYVEANLKVPGPARLENDYVTFQGWMTEKKIHEGHSQQEALRLPTRERLDEMERWMRVGMPSVFTSKS